jgi:transposase, IS5 family
MRSPGARPLKFHALVGLGLADAVPDETARLLDLLNAKLAQERLIIKRGSLLDASFVRAAGRHDSDARSMGSGPHKGKHGYKLHVAVDQDSGLIRKLVATQANVHDASVGAALISDAAKAAIARFNRLIAPQRAVVERTFADLKCRRSLGRARYVGLARNLQHFLLLAFTHNLRRWAVLIG